DQKGNFSKLRETNFIVAANSFFTVFADSVGAAKYNLYGDLSVRVLNCGDLGLSNTDELIMLKDLKGRIIDSVWYYEKWYNKNFINTKNRSLERINPKINSNNEFNWSSSTDLLGATPGKRNSIFTENIYSAQAKISVSPNPFSPDGDGFEDFTILNYQLSKPTSQVRVKIFDSKGRLIKTLLNNHAAGLNNSVIFNGLEDNGTPLRMGIYIIYLEALNENSGTTEILKTTIVVARKLN
ncbi:MAG TPA: FlgD immunoglobulin-like domain containing protein, partial [Ignavibacteriaceae bacterium]|nr:FlgD immunoglobulin-like domain containing protein [Ignavibacteriaceae bacterium]